MCEVLSSYLSICLRNETLKNVIAGLRQTVLLEVTFETEKKNSGDA